jgi:hypothetical protein
MGILRNPIRSPLRSPLYGPLAGKWGGGSLRPDLSIIAKYQALGAQAFLHDFSRTDLTFQEATGQTLADDAGESVALALDSAQWGGKTLAQVIASQPELFTAGTSNNASVVYSGGVATFTASASVHGVQQTGLLTIGKTYEVTFRIVSISSGTIRGYAGSGGIGPDRTAPGTYTQRLTAASTQTASVIAIGTTTAVVDQISFKEIPGYHGIQSGSTGARPTRAADGKLTFDGSDDNLLTTFLLGNTANTLAMRTIFGASGGGVPLGFISTDRFYLGLNISGFLRAGYGTNGDIITGALDLRNQQGTAIVTHDASNVSLYWNGSLVGSAAVAGTHSKTIGLPLGIGRSGSTGATGSPYLGDMYQSAAIQAALTPTEIAQLSSYWNSLP